MNTRIGWTGALLLAMCMSVSAQENGAEDGGAPEGQRGQRQGHMMRNKGKGQQEGRQGPRGRRPGSMMMMDNPEAKAEMERHREAMKAIMQKTRELGQSMRAKMKEAETDEARKALVEANKEQFRTLATERVDEGIKHAQAMVDLQKANRDATINKIVESMGQGRQRPGQREGRRGGGEGEGQGKGRRPQKLGQEQGNGRAEGGQGNGAADIDDIADALEEALE